MRFRDEVVPADAAAVRELVTATGFFSPAEVAIATELVETRIAQGPASGYAFLFAETDDRPSGYTCYGHIPATDGSYDLYWIAVARGDQGRELRRRTEARIRAAGGRQVYIESSSRAQYRPTHGFYLAAGYLQEARLEDFYGPGDNKLIYRRVLRGPAGGN